MNKNKNIKKTFPVIGMSCAACATRVDKTLNQQKGVHTATVNYAAATATIEYDSSICSVQQLKDAIQGAGYDLLTDTEKDSANEAEEIRIQHYRQLKHRTIGAILLSIPLSVISMGFPQMPYAGYIMWALATPALFILGRDFFINAWRQMKHKTSNMDTLVATSTGIAYLFSIFNLLFAEFWTQRGITPHLYFETSAMIIAFILLGRTLEARAKGQTSEAIKKLMGLQPKKVTVRRNGQEFEAAIESIVKGDIIVVKPGERIAVDGTVNEGASYIDESMLSGEPMAVKKSTGSKVYAGTINQKGSFCFQADEVGAETMLAHIIQMVQEAQGSKAPVQKLVDKVAAIFVPTIISIAILTFILWLIFDTENGFTHGLLSAVTILVIACPCALGLATPTAIMVGIGRGAGEGILIKDAESLQIAKKVNLLVLDKTGTITEGKPVVTNWIWDTNPNDYQDIFYSLEKLSEHPLATAIIKSMKAKEIALQQFESITGQGIKASCQGKTYMAGNYRMMKEQGIQISNKLKEQAKELASASKTVVWFATDQQALGIAAITDRIKTESPKAIATLQEMGIDVVMLTGDNQQTAQAIAQQAGINHFEAEMLPQHKAAYIKKQQESGKIVAMAGDGINDSAALAQADLSIAMGQGSDIAMSVAKMTLISSDLTKIAEAIKLSIATVNTIRQNLFWAFIYNLIGVPLAAGILYPINGFLLNPMIAGATMAMSSVSVVTNSLRLRRKKSEKISCIVPQEDLPEEIISQEEVISQKENTPTENQGYVKEYMVEGMMCKHCLARVEKALNTLENVKVTVTLDPPVACITYPTPDDEIPVDELQKVLTEKGGEYTISEK